MRACLVLVIGAMVATGAGFAADCLSCHKAFSSYAQTAHALTSQAPGKESVLGDFHATVRVRDGVPSLTFRMEQRDNDYYETAIAGIPGHEQSHSARVDVVTGSGSRGQSYLYWLGDQLFELPLSYWTDGAQWINSPGFRDGTANFSRPVYPRCLECHATAITALSADPFSNRYDKGSLVMGIACSSCHGQGHPEILNPTKFSRDRQVDLCALCHSGGAREELRPAFSYLPGEPLDRYLKPNPGDAAEQPEVHGNQVGLLKRSKCYVASPAMSCSTCHDVHQPEKAAASYSSKCLGCHEAKSCPRTGPNCIDCHMPRLATNAIVSRTSGKETRASMRTHWIRVY